MKYLFNGLEELREFVKNDFESSYKIELVEKKWSNYSGIKR